MEKAQFFIILIFSPLLMGVIRKLKALMQGRSGPGMLQPYYDLYRLFRKDMVISEHASWIFRATPFIVLGATIAASLIVPVITSRSLLSGMGDVIALVYILAIARFFMALAGLDAATAFGGEGSSREMTVAILVEPMLMLALFTMAIAGGSTNLAHLTEEAAGFYSPSHVLAFFAFFVAVIAETGRVPVDNPDTHLELTMIHEGMVLEYSGPNLALMDWAHQIKQMLLFTIAVDVFVPVGMAKEAGAVALLTALAIYGVKMAAMAGVAAAAESTRAKMRFFQLPSLLGASFVLALLSLLIYIMMGR